MNKQILNKYQVFLICVGLAVLTFIAFEQVRNNDFISYDDNIYITDNPHVTNGLTVDGFVWALTTIKFSEESYIGHWQPITWLSHMLDCELYGLDASGHHMTSLLFHIINTLLLFWVLKKMTGSLWPSTFAAALFAIHSLHVESVAWVTQRRDLLSAFFWLLTMAAYSKYSRKPRLGA